MEALGAFLKKKRLEKGLSYSKLSEKLGVTAMYLCDIENNKRIPMKSELFEKLSIFFNVSIEEIKKMAAIGKTETFKNDTDPNEILELKLVLARRIFEADKMDKKEIQELINQIK